LQLTHVAGLTGVLDGELGGNQLLSPAVETTVDGPAGVCRVAGGRDHRQDRN